MSENWSQMSISEEKEKEYVMGIFLGGTTGALMHQSLLMTHALSTD